MFDMKMISKTAKVLVLLTYGILFTNAFAGIDACKDEMGHVGEGKAVDSKVGGIDGTPYVYELWYQGGTNSMTYYRNGTFTASWKETADCLARVGFQYKEDKTYEELGPIEAYFKWEKSGSGGTYNYIGVYGWTVDPLVEYYIVDDWFNPGASHMGKKMGELEVDGDVYDIYLNRRYNAPSIQGNSEDFPQYFSVRRNARSCGHINVTAHFEKWKELDMKLGKMYEAKLLVEAGDKGEGSLDVTYFKMTDAAHPLSALEESSSSMAESSSSEELPESSSSETESSNSVAGIDACKDEMEHDGDGVIVLGENKETVSGNIGSTPYQYEFSYWQNGDVVTDGNAMTYYDNGTFTAEWNKPNDILARVGFKYNEDKTYEELGPIDAFFKWEKTGSASSFSYIGVYGWTVDSLLDMQTNEKKLSLVEFYIVDDWLNAPNTAFVGQKKGELTVDGDTYVIYQHQMYNVNTIKGEGISYPQYYSVRKHARSCGHIDVTAHFEKWKSLGMKMGKMYEIMLLVEVGGVKDQGSFDLTYFKMTDADHPLPEVSSSSETESSSSSEESVSSSSEAKSSSSVEFSESSSSEESSSSAESPESSSSEFESSSSFEEQSSSSEEEYTTVVQSLRNILTDNSGNLFLVFDMQGRYLGTVEYMQGLNLVQVLLEKFRKPGMYLVRRGKTTQMVRVAAH